jgi:hypothetical protein
LFGNEMEDSGAVAAIADFMMQGAIMVIGILQQRGEFLNSSNRFRIPLALFVLGDNPRLAGSSPA